MPNTKKIIWPILIVDDEWGDIQDLDGLLEEVGVRLNKAEDEDPENFPYHLNNANIRLYTAHPSEAVGEMIRAMNDNERFSAIISDNHMKDTSEEAIFGEDFLRIIKGFPVYCSSKDENDLDIPLEEIASAETFKQVLDLGGRQNDEILDFLEGNFKNPEEYVRMVTYYFGDEGQHPLLVMMCGNPRKADLTGIEDEVYLIGKQISKSPRGGRNFCERDLMYLLGEREILPLEFIQPSIEEHPRLGNGINPSQQLYKDSRRKRN